MEMDLNMLLACIFGVMAIIIIILTIILVIVCNSKKKPYTEKELNDLNYERPNKIKLNEINMVGCKNEKKFKVYNFMSNNKN